MARLKLKKQLEQRLKEVNDRLDDMIPLQEEKAEIERLLATYGPEETGCGSSCPGCDICRRGMGYR
jgi:hypothetical protein